MPVSKYRTGRRAGQVEAAKLSRARTDATRVYPQERGAEYELPDGTTFGLWGGAGDVMPFQPSNGILFTVNDLAASVTQLRERGIPIVKEIDTPGCSMAMIMDTEGNMVAASA